DKKNVTYYVKNVSHQMNLVTIILPVVLCSVILVGFMILTTRQMGGGSGSKMMDFGKSHARRIDVDDNEFTFDNVAGLAEEKEE
ncbi:ATP-dependent metalloprotease, partial [Klebsiella pneumoniae]|nr:ATP-dependent metalloprotease [Klebsiella pneumoniae]